jgi:putative ABC transport system permease protein
MKCLPLPLALVAAGVALGMSAAFAQVPETTLPTVLISRQLAEASELRVGSVARFATDSGGSNARDFRVVGIYEPHPDPMELNASKHEARLHLPDLLAMTTDAGGSEEVAAINVRLASGADPDAFARDISARIPGVTASPAVSSGVDTFVVLERFHQAIATVTILASTVFLLALSVMLVDERRETVGILRLIGLTSRRVLVQVLVEGLIIASAGALFGLLVAMASEGLINAYFQWHYDTALVFVRVTPSIWLRCVAIAVPLGAAASVAASWMLLRRHVLSLARR